MINHIVFDMDNTLVDELGATVRPGIKALLDELVRMNVTLTLWTSSTGDRAKPILFEHGLHRCFSKHVFREDYDPENRGVHKDIRKVKGELLVDDDPAEIRYVRSLGLKGYLLAPYRKHACVDPNELRVLLDCVKKG